MKKIFELKCICFAASHLQQFHGPQRAEPPTLGTTGVRAEQFCCIVYVKGLRSSKYGIFLKKYSG